MCISACLIRDRNSDRHPYVDAPVAPPSCDSQKELKERESGSSGSASSSSSSSVPDASSAVDDLTTNTGDCILSPGHVSVSSAVRSISLFSHR